MAGETPVVFPRRTISIRLVEDRLSAGLWLEMTDQPAETYVSDRVPEVLELEGVERASWFENACQGRDDFPRQLPEFRLLAVYEVGESFAGPPAPTGVSGLHFLRYPRPAQGRLTGEPTRGLLLVLISPREPEGAQALRDWGDFVHLRHIAEAVVPGYTMITPYENAVGGDPRFMHFYEMDSDDPEATFQTMTPLVTERLGEPGTPAWDEWALHPQLRIFYVNTFRRVGELTP